MVSDRGRLFLFRVSVSRTIKDETPSVERGKKYGWMYLYDAQDHGRRRKWDVSSIRKRGGRIFFRFPHLIYRFSRLFDIV